MNKLAGKLSAATCEPCRGGTPPLTDDEIQPLAAEVPEWSVRDVDGIKRLERLFSFPDFKQAMAFAVRAGEVAEAEQHHPDLHVGWGKVRVEVWTHKIRGLHKNDFILAAKIDRLVAPQPA